MSERDDDLVSTYDAILAEDSAPGAVTPVAAAPPATTQDSGDLQRTYDAILAEDDADTKRRANAVQGVAGGYQPDAYAEAVKLGSEFGINPKTVADNPEPYRKESKRRATAGTLEDTPATREWLTNLDNAAVAQDDIENLTDLERSMQAIAAVAPRVLAGGPLAASGELALWVASLGPRGVADVARSLPAGAVKGAGMTISGAGRLLGVGERRLERELDFGLRAIGADSLADSIAEPSGLPDWAYPERLLLGVGSEVERWADIIGAPVERQNIATDIAGGLGQIATQVAAALASRGLSLGMLLGQGADIQGDRAEAAGASQQDTDTAVALGAAITAITERYQLDNLLKAAPAGVKLALLDRLKHAFIAGGGEALQEVTEGILQNFTARMIYEPDAPIFEGLERDAIAAGGAGAIAKLVIDAIVPGRARVAGENNAVNAKNLIEILSDSKLAQRSPEQLESLATKIKEQTGIDHAYVDLAAFRTLYQSDDEANAAANELSGGQNTYFEAALSGTPIAVPMEKFIARLAPKLATVKVEGKPFSDFVAFDPDGMNGKEASEARANIEALAKDIAERELKGLGPDSSQGVYDDVRSQLIEAGYEPGTAEYNAIYLRAWFRTAGTRTQTDPLELWQKYGVKIMARFLGGAELGAELVQSGQQDGAAPGVTPATPAAGDPGSDAGNGFKTGTQGGRYRVSKVASTGGLALEKRYSGGTAATFYIGKNGQLIDADNINLVGSHGTDQLWMPHSESAALEAMSLLDQLGRLDLNDPRRAEVKNRIKQLVSAAGATELTQSGDVTQTDSPEFKRWFGESKVVDAKGKPLRVYHGTVHDIENFDATLRDQNTKGASDSKEGFFFTSDPAEASAYAYDIRGRSDGGNIVPAYVRMENPRTLQNPGSLKEIREAAQAAKSNGHDGLIIEWPAGERHFLAFDPTQIKSATGNTGAFDPTNDNILYQSDGTSELPFYSALTRAAENATNNKASPAQWIATLKSTPGVKPEEIETTGVEQWLNEQGKSVTKEDVIDYLEANQLVIEEKETGALPQEAIDDVLNDIAAAEGSFADWASGDADYQVVTEPTPEYEKFRTDQRVIDEEGDRTEVELRVEITSFEPANEGWKEGGLLNATVKFPDGRRALTGASISSDLQLDPYGTRDWGYGSDDFTDSEIEAIEEAVKEIVLDANSELDPQLQSASDSYDASLQQARRYLNNHNIPRAIEELEEAASLEREYGDDSTAQSMIQALQQESGTKHDQWTMPGGEDYTELKLMLPVPSPPRAQALELAHSAAGLAYSNLNAAKTRGAPEEELAPLKAALDAAKKAVPPPIRDYISPEIHWPGDEKNIVAFVRFNSRIDADGKRVLFLEEIQSDWHADARKDDDNDVPRGYEDPGAKAAYDAALTERAAADEKALGLWDEYEQSGGTGRSAELLDGYNAAKAAADQAEARVLEAKEAMKRSEKAVPDAPFKTTWQELGFKRMLRYAAENGFERIAWTTGEMQIERYSLAKVVDEIEVVREADGQFTYRAKKDSQPNPLQQDTVKNIEALAGALGSKDMAKQAAALEPGGSVKLRGENLKVGGAKQRLLYDVALPATVNKLVKKWGGKVGRTTIKGLGDRATDNYRVIGVGEGREGVPLGDFKTEAEAIEHAQRYGGKVDVLKANDKAVVQSIDITAAMHEAALAGLPMFQRGTDAAARAGANVTADKRGSITFGTDRKFTINLYEKRDLSTFLHESGHLFLEIMGDLAQETDAPQQIREDYQTLLKWMKVADRAGIGVEQHEQFARGIEAYLAEGKAPSVELQPVFFRFRQWLLDVYKSIKRLGSTPGSIGAALNVSLTDEVRAVMDRMVATDEEIATAERSQQYAPIFTDAEAAGMSQAEWSAYREIVDRAHRESVDELTGRALAELSREKRAWWKEERGKVLEEVTAEVNGSPLYRAIAFLTRAKNPDGSALTQGTPTFKLSKADIGARFGKDALKALPRGSTTTATEGISAETAAQLLGFPSGADLVRALTAAPKKRKLIQQLTDQRMRERHGDMMTDGSLVEQAIDSVHTEGRAKVLAAELKALKRKRNEVKDFVAGATAAQNQARRQAREANEASLPTRDEMKAIRLAAQRAIAAKKIRTITPQLYRRAEVKAAKLAFEMAGKGKFEEAYLAKRQQILNYELYRAAVDARTQIDKHVAYMRRFDDKAVRAKLAAAKGQYLAQIDALRERYDFTQQLADADLKRDALTKWVDEQIAAGREVNIPQWVIDEARTTPYKELLAIELDGLVDAAKNIEHLAKTKDQLLRNRAKAKFAAAKLELETRARASLKGGKAPPVSQFEIGFWKEHGNRAMGFLDSLERGEFLVEALDGGTAGPWHDFLMEPANNAEYAREDLRTKILEPMRKLANSIDDKRREELHKPIQIDSLGQSFNRRTLISIALNMGNASNLERLLKGGFRDITKGNRISQFTPQSLIEIKEKLNQTDWQFIQEMWNTAESLWPQMKAFQERMGGLVPEKIPATPIVTRFGTFTGGYWPAVYDSLASKAGAEQADSTQALGILMGANFTKATTSKSALQERTAAGGPLKLDFSAVMGRHLDQVITDLTHREFAIQAMRILDDKDLKLTLQDTIGEIGWASLRGMVAAAIQQDGGFGDLATREIENTRSRFLRKLAVAALGVKVVTAFGNLVMGPIQAGLLNPLPGTRVKSRYILTGFAKFMRHPIDVRDFVHGASPMMRNRAQNMDASFTVIREQLEGRATWLANTQRAAMQIHQTSDYLTTTGIWLGAYTQARDARETHEEAVRLADKAIRTSQTAGAPKDLSAFERNPAYKELKLFIGPMIIMHNSMRAGVQRKGIIKHWPEAVGAMITAWLLPAIIWELATGRGPDDDDDDGSKLDDALPWALRKILVYPFMTMPYWRDAVGLIERQLTGKYAEARMSPISDAIYLAAKTGKTAYDQMSEDDPDDSDDARKLIKAGVNVAGPLIGLPSSQVDVTGSFLWDVMSDEYDPKGAGDLRYLLIRRPKEE